MPLTSKGRKIMRSMKKTYGPEAGERVFYATRNKGRITGVDPESSGLRADEVAVSIGALRRMLNLEAASDACFASLSPRSRAVYLKAHAASVYNIPSSKSADDPPDAAPAMDGQDPDKALNQSETAAEVRPLHMQGMERAYPHSPALHGALKDYHEKRAGDAASVPLAAAHRTAARKHARAAIALTRRAANSRALSHEAHRFAEVNRLPA